WCEWRKRLRLRRGSARHARAGALPRQNDGTHENILNGLAEEELRAGVAHRRDRGLAGERVLHFPAGDRLPIAIRRAAIPSHTTARFPARQSERDRRCIAKIATAAAMDLQRACWAFCSRKTFHRYGRTA